MAVIRLTLIAESAFALLLLATAGVQAQEPIPSGLGAEATAEVQMAVANTAPPCEPWEHYVRFGGVFPVGGGTLESHLKSGWTIQTGFMEPIGRPSSSLAFFREFGGMYSGIRGDEAPVTFLGFFQGRNPTDDHTHFLSPITGEVEETPTEQAPQVGELIITELENLARAGVHFAFGGTYSPPFFNGGGSQWVFVSFRGGVRTGIVDVDYNKSFPEEIAESIEDHREHGHQSIFLSTTGGEDGVMYLGVFGSVGVGVVLGDARFLSWNLGEMTLALEGELGHDWFDLGVYSRGDDGLATFAPTVKLGFRY